MSEGVLSNRYFRQLSDRELFDWKPQTPRGWFGWAGYPDCANVSRANREMRRRAAVSGLTSAYEWLASTNARASFDYLRWMETRA